MKTSDEYLAELELKEIIDKKINFNSFIFSKRNESFKSLDVFLSEEKETHFYVLDNHILVKFLERNNPLEHNDKNISVDTSMFFTMTYFIDGIIVTGSKEQMILNIENKINLINENIKKYHDITKEEKDILNKYIYGGQILIKSIKGQNKLFITPPVLGELNEYFDFNRSLSKVFASSHRDIDIFIKRLFCVILSKIEDLPYTKGIYNLANKFARQERNNENALPNYENLIRAYSVVGKLNILKD